MWSDNESKEDLLGFQYLADAVVSIVKNENLLPATIGVFGDWGGGKSTLIEIIKTQLSSSAEKEEGVWCSPSMDGFLRAMKEPRLPLWAPSLRNCRSMRLS
jgi:pantothenate kinase